MFRVGYNYPAFDDVTLVQKPLKFAHEGTTVRHFLLEILSLRYITSRVDRL